MSDKKKIISDEQREKIANKLKETQGYAKAKIDELELPAKVSEWSSEQKAKFDAFIVDAKKDENVAKALEVAGVAKDLVDGILTAASQKFTETWNNPKTQEAIETVKCETSKRARELHARAKKFWRNNF